MSDFYEMYRACDYIDCVFPAVYVSQTFNGMLCPDCAQYEQQFVKEAEMQREEDERREQMMNEWFDHDRGDWRW